MYICMSVSPTEEVVDWWAPDFMVKHSNLSSSIIIYSEMGFLATYGFIFIFTILIVVYLIYKIYTINLIKLSLNIYKIIEYICL